MNYIIKLFYGSNLLITDNECQQIFENWEKLDKFVIKSANRIIDKRLIAEILKEEDFNKEKQEIEKTKRDKQQVGILHDGIKVIKHYGKWIKEDSLYIGQNGETLSEPCHFDYNYYPELALNQVKTPEEYFEWQTTKTPYLPVESKENQLRIGDITSISDIL